MSALRGMGVVVTARSWGRAIAATLRTWPGVVMVSSTVRCAAARATWGRALREVTIWAGMA